MNSSPCSAAAVQSAGTMSAATSGSQGSRRRRSAARRAHRMLELGRAPKARMADDDRGAGHDQRQVREGVAERGFGAGLRGRVADDVAGRRLRIIPLHHDGGGVPAADHRGADVEEAPELPHAGRAAGQRQRAVVIGAVDPPVGLPGGVGGEVEDVGDVVEGRVVVEVGPGDVARDDLDAARQGLRRTRVGEARQPRRDAAAARLGVGRPHEAAPGVAVSGHEGVMQDGAADQTRRPGQKNRAQVPRPRHSSDIDRKKVLDKAPATLRPRLQPAVAPEPQPRTVARAAPPRDRPVPRPATVSGRPRPAPCPGQADTASLRNSGTL